MSNIIEVNEVTKRFASKTALDGVSFNIPTGSVFGLLGPNGAGKTTLIRIINRITAPDSGEILFDGHPISQDDIPRIGYLPEERGLYRKMKVGEQALYLAMLKGMSKQEAIKSLKEWFVKFEIIDWWNKKVEELSKGMAQKIQFIVTVVNRPKLLILDEPFSGFDPINTNLIKTEILRLNKEGASIIFSTHNMASVEEICSDIALINDAKVILNGKVSDIKENYKEHIYEVVFRGNFVKFTNALWTGAEIIDKAQLSDNVYSARVKLLRDHKTNDLLNNLLPNVEILGLQEILPSMNDIFIRAVTEIPEQTTEINE